MPLQTGSSREAISTNIKELVQSGHPQEQAIAIAMHKAGMTRDAMGAGVMISSPEDLVLFLRRSAKSDHPGTWCFPGGHVEKGESSEEAAVRELKEETGAVAEPDELLMMSALGDFDTFHLFAPSTFTPNLNEEHTEFQWAKMSELPSPMHPGVWMSLQLAYPDSANLVEYEVRDSMITMDRGFFAPTSAGKTRRLTPEGFLVCEDIGIARVGTQMYAAHELPGLEPGPDGKIIVERRPEEVFHPDTIASFEGKPVTLFHPREFVNPENWRQHSVGHIQHVRRGTGPDSDLLMGDILITDAAAVHYAQANLPDISCGYDAKYKSLGPGRASQHEIRGNHGAMVPNGRAGDRCAIRDQSTQDEEFFYMGKSTVAAAVAAFFRGKGLPDAASAELQALVEPLATRATRDDDGGSSAGAGAMMDAIRALDAKVTAVRDWQQAYDADEEKARKEAKDAADKAVKDAAAKDAEEEKEKKDKEKTDDTLIEAESVGSVISLGKVWTAKTGDQILQELFANAEILSPGIAQSRPTTDSLRGNQGSTLTRFLQSALDRCYTKDAAGKELVEPFLMGNKIGDMRGMTLVGAFNGAAQLARLRNNAGTRSLVGVRMATADGRSPALNVGQGAAAAYAANLAKVRKESAA